jgi:hypothetical protein
MSTATVTAPRASRRAATKAKAYLEANAAWPRLRDPHTGRVVGYGIPSESRPGLYHLTNGRVCDCHWFRHRTTKGGPPCSHIRAAALYIEQHRRPQPEPTTEEGAAARTVNPRVDHEVKLIHFALALVVAADAACLKARAAQDAADLTGDPDPAIPDLWADAETLCADAYAAVIAADLL